MTCVPEAGCRAGVAKAWRGRPVPAQTRNSQAALSHHGFSEAAEKGRGSPGTLLPLYFFPFECTLADSCLAQLTPACNPCLARTHMACSACRLRDVAAGPHCRACRALINLQRLVQGPSLPESLDPVVTAFLERVVGLVRGLAEAHTEPEDYEEPTGPAAEGKRGGRSGPQLQRQLVQAAEAILAPLRRPKLHPALQLACEGESSF